MISFLKLTASLNKILLFRKASFDGWCPCGSKLNSTSKEEVNSVAWRVFPANSGGIDKTHTSYSPIVQVHEKGQSFFALF